MDEAKPDDPAPSPEAGRSRSAPPTIDLEASEVTSPAEDTGTRGQASRSARLSSAALPSVLVAAVAGAATAALVMAGAWAIGWPGETARPQVQADSRVKNNANVIETLSS